MMSISVPTLVFILSAMGAMLSSKLIYRYHPNLSKVKNPRLTFSVAVLCAVCWWAILLYYGYYYVTKKDPKLELVDEAPPQAIENTPPYQSGTELGLYSETFEPKGNSKYV